MEAHRLSKETTMCFRPPAVEGDKVMCPKCGTLNDSFAPACAGCGATASGPAAPSAPGMPSAPGVPSAPGMPSKPGAPSKPGVPSAPGQPNKA